MVLCQKQQFVRKKLDTNEVFQAHNPMGEDPKMEILNQMTSPGAGVGGGPTPMSNAQVNQEDSDEEVYFDNYLAGPVTTWVAAGCYRFVAGICRSARGGGIPTYWMGLTRH